MQQKKTLDFESFLSSPIKKNATLFWLISNDYGDVQITIKHILDGHTDGVESTQYLDAEEISAEHLQRELYGLSLFSTKKILVLKRFEAASTFIKKILQRYIENPSFIIVLILISKNDADTANLRSSIEKKGVILNLLEEKPWEKQQRLSRYILQTMKKEDKQISPEVVQLLIKQTAADTEILSHEMNKLFSYIGQKKVVVQQDVWDVCVSAQNETIWQLRDAILAQDGKVALSTLQILQLEGLNALGVIQTIRLHLQTACYLCEWKQRNGEMSEVAKEFPYLKGKNLDKVLSHSLTYGLARLKKAIVELFSADISLRSTSNAPYALLQQLVLKLVY